MVDGDHEAAAFGKVLVSVRFHSRDQPDDETDHGNDEFLHGGNFTRIYALFLP